MPPEPARTREGASAHTGDVDAAPRHLVSIDDLGTDEILELFARARSFSEDLRAHAHLCPGTISASLFYEASTRTRLSFESAMLRLGGGVLTAAEMKTSSSSKGESLADTVRVVSGYADIIVLRHSSEGAARLASRYATVPVVNAGDGSHEHPTQTLCDLYTLWIERGRLEGLDVVLAGDLRYSRTIHSFIYALARFRANIVCVPHPGLELPDYVLRRLHEEYGAEPVRADATQLGGLAGESDALYLTPHKPHQLSLFTELSSLRVDRGDALYMTRPQTERHKGENSDKYMRVGAETMALEPLRDALVMHPLPRRDEIDASMDTDPRGVYFKQAARGVPIRMAIIAMLLGKVPAIAARPRVAATYFDLPAGKSPCPNPNCISHTEARHVQPAFRLRQRHPLRAGCAYCSQELSAPFVASRRDRVFFPRTDAKAQAVPVEDLVFLQDEREALELGFAKG
ncbi:MAG: aspartate carbamoyltransferase catalytic subunit [Planctomycetota bacterium]